MQRTATWFGIPRLPIRKLRVKSASQKLNLLSTQSATLGSSLSITWELDRKANSQHSPDLCVRNSRDGAGDEGPNKPYCDSGPLFGNMALVMQPTRAHTWLGKTRTSTGRSEYRGQGVHPRTHPGPGNRGRSQAGLMPPEVRCDKGG